MDAVNGFLLRLKVAHVDVVDIEDILQDERSCPNQ